MSVSGVYLLHGINFPGGQFLSQLDDATPAANLDDLIGYASGHADPLFLATSRCKVDQSFTTTQIKTILDLMGAGGMVDLAAGNTDLYYKKALAQGVRELDASTVHVRMRAALACAYWNEISAAQDQNATLQGRVLPIYNGSVAPLVPAASVALAGTPTAAEFYTLGPVVINGSEVLGLKNVRVSLGMQAFEEGASGDLYTTFAGVKQRGQVVELESLEAGLWATMGLLGTAVTSLAVYLRRRDPDGGLYSNGSSQHIAITATKGKCVPATTSGGGNNPSQTKLRIPLRASSSSAAVLTVATTSTIP